jgi:hypothetical protein
MPCGSPGYRFGVRAPRARRSIAFASGTPLICPLLCARVEPAPACRRIHVTEDRINTERNLPYAFDAPHDPLGPFFVSGVTVSTAPAQRRAMRDSLRIRRTYGKSRQLNHIPNRARTGRYLASFPRLRYAALNVVHSFDTATTEKCPSQFVDGISAIAACCQPTDMLQRQHDQVPLIGPQFHCETIFVRHLLSRSIRSRWASAGGGRFKCALEVVQVHPTSLPVARHRCFVLAPALVSPSAAIIPQFD